MSQSVPPFFSGWRRKLGVVTLVLACVFAVGWARSTARYDLVLLPWGNRTFCVELMWGYINIGRITHTNNPTLASWKSNQITTATWRYLDEHGQPQPADNLAEMDEIEWRWDWSDFHFGAAHNLQMRCEDYIFPYWSIVVPLTLLSAYLILARRRVVKSPELA